MIDYSFIDICICNRLYFFVVFNEDFEKFFFVEIIRRFVDDLILQMKVYYFDFYYLKKLVYLVEFISVSVYIIVIFVDLCFIFIMIYVVC